MKKDQILCSRNWSSICLLIYQDHSLLGHFLHQRLRIFKVTTILISTTTHFFNFVTLRSSNDMGDKECKWRSNGWNKYTLSAVFMLSVGNNNNMNHISMEIKANLNQTGLTEITARHLIKHDLNRSHLTSKHISWSTKRAHSSHDIRGWWFNERIWELLLLKTHKDADMFLIQFGNGQSKEHVKWFRIQNITDSIWNYQKKTFNLLWCTLWSKSQN